MSVILFTRGWLPSMHHRSHDRGGLYPWEGVCIQVGVCIQGWRTASRKVEGLHLGGGGLRKGGLHLGGGRSRVSASRGRGSAYRGSASRGQTPPTGTRKADSIHPTGMLLCPSDVRLLHIISGGF